MVDAAIGGKTGINLGDIKNQVGTFHHPTQFLSIPDFLKHWILRAIKRFRGDPQDALVADSRLWKNWVRSG